jgi:hypothetical protein
MWEKDGVQSIVTQVGQKVTVVETVPSITARKLSELVMANATYLSTVPTPVVAGGTLWASDQLRIAANLPGKEWIEADGEPTGPVVFDNGTSQIRIKGSSIANSALDAATEKRMADLLAAYFAKVEKTETVRSIAPDGRFVTTTTLNGTKPDGSAFAVSAILAEGKSTAISAFVLWDPTTVKEADAAAWIKLLQDTLRSL